MSSYAERISTPVDKPQCWGNPRAFSPTDDDCEACRSFHTCRQAVNEKTTQTAYRPIQIGRPPSAPVQGYPLSRFTNPTEYVNWAPGPMNEEDPAFSRFLKDGASGGLRGMFHEFYRFFTVYRFK